MLLSDGCESCSECHLLIAYHLRLALREQVLVLLLLALLVLQPLVLELAQVPVVLEQLLLEQ
jgi:hypothetical protein